MPTILYPTRGGRSSYPNQDYVFTLAREQHADLLLLYVSNVEFLGMVSRAKVVDIETELDHMGEFLLAMAQERAQKAGVEAEILVRRGDFNEVLRQVIAEHAVDTLVLGAPSEETGLTTLEFLQSLSQNLATESGVHVHLIQDGNPIGVFAPQEGTPDA
ncbi:MAG: hypothetical protein D6755_00075 [Anaerolineae bacterium]|nr:MAG: hypothetical protein D6755_00075 [Anaerolineae bacterium]